MLIHFTGLNAYNWLSCGWIIRQSNPITLLWTLINSIGCFSAPLGCFSTPLFCSNCWLQVVINNNDYINWHVVGFLRLRCCCGIITNRFSSEHVLYFNFFGAFHGFMLYVKTKIIQDNEQHFSLFNRLGFCSCYKFCRLNCSNWHNLYLSFPIMTKFSLNDRFYHNWYKLMLI
jgi:hypothetical protein